MAYNQGSFRLQNHPLQKDCSLYTKRNFTENIETVESGICRCLGFSGNWKGDSTTVTQTMVWALAGAFNATFIGLGKNCRNKDI